MGRLPPIDCTEEQLNNTPEADEGFHVLVDSWTLFLKRLGDYREGATEEDANFVYNALYQYAVDACERYALDLMNEPILEAHSGTEDQRFSLIDTNSRSQNVAFADQADAYMQETISSVDETRTHQDSDDATLSNFFSRPIKIEEFEWGVGIQLFDGFDPWDLYFNNPRVVNRISNYNLLRAKLHVKFVINGNGFYYGRAIASYLPLNNTDTLSANIALIPETIVQASQQPHIFLDPTTSSGADMMLPFFYHKNYLSIPDAEWEDMGFITVRSINDLKNANGATGNVTVSVFAWAEDVQLSVLTSVEPSTIVPQSGMEIDEVNKTGVISGPATTFSRLADAMSAIPHIAPYAMATSKLANGVASLAKLFGYSRPAVTANPAPYRPTMVSELATTTVGDATSKLTIDDKQELTIDPRISGVGDADPLVLANIAQKESYLTTFDWDVADNPDTLLWNSRVSPVLWAEDATLGGFHFPACAMAALPFQYWTGSMRFRFQIVASAFHKGRLKIVYDPKFLATNEYNTNYTQVIDIADTSDFTIQIGNGQEVSLLDHSIPGVDSVTTIYGTSTFGSVEPGNGVIGVYVVNDLTTPNTTVDNDIQVNVFVSTGPDFEAFVPSTEFMSFVFKPQSGLELQSGTELPSQTPESENTPEKNRPEQDNAMMLGPTLEPLTNLNKVFTGECIKSFRQVLKRYAAWTAIGPNDTTNTRLYLKYAFFPFLRGNVTNAVHTTSGAAPYNYCNTLLLHWVTAAFSGVRGSIRYKGLVRGDFDRDDRAQTVWVERTKVNTSGDLFDFSSSGWSGYSSPSSVAESVILENSAADESKPAIGPYGALYRNSLVNVTPEFEVPYYSNRRFVPGKIQDWTGNTNSSLNIPGFTLKWWVDGGTSTSMDIWVAAGEDFQCYFFTGLPPMYYESSPPAPI